jgi:hypothetical protein
VSHQGRYPRNLVADVPDVPDNDLLLFAAEIMGHNTFAQFSFFAIINVDA